MKFLLFLNKLATIDSKKHSKEIYNPANGKVVNEITPATSWPLTGTITLEFGKSDLP